MKETLKEYIRPTIGKIVLTIFLLAWQYFYSYQNIRFDFLVPYVNYATGSLASINWNNYFVRNFSLLLIWIIVALVIFTVIWLVEKISISLYNHKISKKYAGSSREDYENLMRSSVSYFEHIKSRTLWIAGILIILISLFALSDLFERLRFSILDSFMWNMIENGVSIDVFNPAYIIGSFVAMSIFWYLISAFVFFIFYEQKTKEKEEEISEEHFAIPVETKSDGK